MGVAAGAVGVGMGAMQMVQAGNDAKMQKKQAEFDAMQMRFNAGLIKYQQEDLQDQKTRDIVAREQQVKAMLGSQKANLAAQGIDVEGEIGEDIAYETREIGMDDVQAIKNNAWRESMGLEIKRVDMLNGARSTILEGRSRANATQASGMISGIGSIAQGVGQMKKAGGFGPKSRGSNSKSGKYSSGSNIFS